MSLSHVKTYYSIYIPIIKLNSFRSFRSCWCLELFSTEANYFQDTKQHYNYIRLQRFLFLAPKDIYIIWLMIYFGLIEDFSRNSANAHWFDIYFFTLAYLSRKFKDYSYVSPRNCSACPQPAPLFPTCSPRMREIRSWVRSPVRSTYKIAICANPLSTKL